MRPLVMGVLNVTPDSFYDGGLFLDPAAAIARGEEMIAEGADVVDIGGESTRPGAAVVPEDEELRRVMPVIEALAGRVRLSIDTSKQRVARLAVAAGATLINDVSAQLALAEVAAETGTGYIAMHMRGTPADMQVDPVYRDVVAEVCDFLRSRALEAVAAGVGEVWVDPGIGFGKTLQHNLALLRHLDEVVALGWPVVVGTSRKSFLGRISGTGDAPASERLEASIATAVYSMQAGAQMVRVHDVSETVQAARLVGEEVA